MGSLSYTETLDFLYSKLPMFSRIGTAAYKKDLSNTIELCNYLENPQNKFKSIHIAGTNGKGSTSHMLAAILQEAGYKTGLYTSPHLKDFRERIKINGVFIPEQNVIDFTKTIATLIESIEPSFFEITVAMAFDYFAKENVDIAIIETGLGGRLDSTNVITPLLSIITNIGYDHQNLLGNTLPEIAFEKAGIIKKNIPVIIGEVLEETKNVFINKTIETNSEIYFAEQEVIINDMNPTLTKLEVSTINKISNTQEKYELDLNGIYQSKNLKSVIVAKNILRNLGFILPAEKVLSALSKVKKLTGLHGRWEVIQTTPTVILDVAHNKDGITQILLQIETYKNKNYFENLHFIIGMVQDKDVESVLALLPKNATYYFTQSSIPRALEKESLQAKASAFHLNGDTYNNVNEALQNANLNATNDDLIIICGSVFLVGEVQL